MNKLIPDSVIINSNNSDKEFKEKLNHKYSSNKYENLSEISKSVIDIYVESDDKSLTTSAIMLEIKRYIFSFIRGDKDYTLFDSNIVDSSLSVIKSCVSKIVSDKADNDLYRVKILHSISILLSIFDTDKDAVTKLQSFIDYFVDVFTSC